MPMRVATFIVSTILCYVSSSSPARAQTVSQLAKGDRFAAGVTIFQETTLRFDGGEPSVSRSSERLALQYEVQSNEESTLTVDVSLRQSNRRNLDGLMYPSRNASTAKPMCRVSVDERGQTSLVSPQEFRFQEFAGSDEGSLIIAKATSPDVMLSWVSLPFWVVSGAKPEAGVEWQRSHVMSLGLAGSLRTDAVCRIEALDDESLQLKIEGKGTALPLTLPTQVTDRIRLEDVSIDVQTFSGKGTVELSAGESEDDASSGHIPPLSRLQLRWVVAGSATVQAADRKVAVDFRHEQSQLSEVVLDRVLNGWQPQNPAVTPAPQ